MDQVCVFQVLSVIISLSLLYYTDRHPKKVSPWLNLVKLFTPTSWAWILASLISVGLCFNVTSLMIKRWMGMRLMTIHIDLCPFRCFSIVGCFKSAVCFQCIFSHHLWKQDHSSLPKFALANMGCLWRILHHKLYPLQLAANSGEANIWGACGICPGKKFRLRV